MFIEAISQMRQQTEYAIFSDCVNELKMKILQTNNIRRWSVIHGFISSVYKTDAACYKQAREISLASDLVLLHTAITYRTENAVLHKIETQEL